MQAREFADRLHGLVIQQRPIVDVGRKRLRQRLEVDAHLGVIGEKQTLQDEHVLGDEELKRVEIGKFGIAVNGSEVSRPSCGREKIWGLEEQRVAGAVFRKAGHAEGA